MRMKPLKAVLDLLPQFQKNPGLYHFSQPDETSWCGFAKKIVVAARKIS